MKHPRQVLFCWCVVATACGGNPDGGNIAQGGAGGSTAGPCAPEAIRDALRLNEISSSNSGNAIDENGNTGDWIELVNSGTESAELSGFELGAGTQKVILPAGAIEPGQRVVFWADKAPATGKYHLPFKLSSQGETVTLTTCGKAVDKLQLPKIAANDVMARFPDSIGAFSLCRYATPEHSNGDSCEPSLPPNLVLDHNYAAFAWPDQNANVSKPVAISELVLKPAGFVELVNTGDQAVLLDDYRLTISSLKPGQSWPTATDGIALPLPPGTSLEPGKFVVVPLLASDTNAIAADPHFEGVVTLFDLAGAPADRVDFAHVPEGASLARLPAYPGRLVFCLPQTPNTANDSCQILPSRDIASYDRHLRTLGDFEALSDGAGELGLASVKFILDMDAGNQIYLPNALNWSLHYEFIRELIDGQPHLNRCDAMERAFFNRGWYNFSVEQYFQETGRRYLLGTLEHHASTDLYSVEFALGDQITAADMKKAFFAVMAHVPLPKPYYLRPQDAAQTARAMQLEGQLPIISTNAPFVNVKWQPLTAGIGYGTLQFVAAADLMTADLGPDVIVLTDDVPNDLPLVGGLITEAFQTPLSHVNVLCQNRGTPNVAVPKARQSQPFADLLGKLVRFEVTADGYHVTAAEPSEAQAFWDAHRGKAGTLVPRLDGTRSDFVDLATATLDDLPSIGAKAAQLSEVIATQRTYDASTCGNGATFQVPTPAFAIPVRYFLQHLTRSGADAMLAQLLADATLLSDRTQRHAQLQKIRDTILKTPVEPSTLAPITTFVDSTYGTTTIRFRSSSNAEDLPGFNGAGLYTSTSVKLGDPAQTVEGGLRTVWSSLFRDRAFDERELLRIDHTKVAMAVLVHPAFLSERANGVIITRDIQDILRGDIYTFNAQTGEASVTNPAPGVASDEFIYRLPPRMPPITERSRSSFTNGTSVMTEAEVVSASCAAQALVNHFQPLLDPDGKNAYFTLDLEFKLIGPDRQLLFKQARPYAFGSWTDPGDCRQF